MGIFDKLFGSVPEPERQPTQGSQRGPARGGAVGTLADEQAIDRYRYLLKTAPPEAIEQAHEEAFAQLSPEQRRSVLEQLSSDAPEYEQGATRSKADDPRSLARMATRAEMRRPGTLERTFGGLGPGGQIGVGGLLAGSFMSSLVGTVIGSMVAQQFFADDDHQQLLADGGNDKSSDEASAADDAGQEASADAENERRRRRRLRRWGFRGVTHTGRSGLLSTSTHDCRPPTQLNHFRDRFFTAK